VIAFILIAALLSQLKPLTFAGIFKIKIKLSN